MEKAGNNLKDIRGWLESYLSDGRIVNIEKIYEDGRAIGFSRGDIRKAKQTSDVIRTVSNRAATVWYWVELPEA